MRQQDICGAPKTENKNTPPKKNKMHLYYQQGYTEENLFRPVKQPFYRGHFRPIPYIIQLFFK